MEDECKDSIHLTEEDEISLKDGDANTLIDVTGQDDETLSLSLSGELSLFDGLKFEDGDVIDVGIQSGMDDEDIKSVSISEVDEQDQEGDDVGMLF